MVDIESQVFTAVYNAVTSVYTSAYVTSKYEPVPESLPCVFLEEIENIAVKSTRDSGSTDRHSAVAFKCEIYSNESRAQAKAIATIVDGVMCSMGFTRTQYTPVSNLYDASVMRIVLTWTAVVDANQKIYRR